MPFTCRSLTLRFGRRLDLILSTPEPFIKTIENSAEDEAGAMLDIDLDESLDRYVRERAALVETTKTAFARRVAKNRRPRGVRSLFGIHHVPASVRPRDAPRLPDRTADAREGTRDLKRSASPRVSKGDALELSVFPARHTNYAHI